MSPRGPKWAKWPETLGILAAAPPGGHPPTAYAFALCPLHSKRASREHIRKSFASPLPSRQEAAREPGARRKRVQGLVWGRELGGAVPVQNGACGAASGPVQLRR